MTSLFRNTRVIQPVSRCLVRYNATHASLQQQPMEPPLAGVRVLDLTTALAGPSCAMYLGDLGAEVIKLEVPRKGDDSRHWGPPFMQHTDKENTKAFSKNLDRQSAYFVAVNRNKKSVTVNLKTERGIKIAKELAKSADILIENQVSGKLEKLGLGYAAVKEINPSVVYCSITGYGQTGPYRTAPGYDAVVGGEAGIVHATGEPDRAPVRPGIPVTDIMTGYAAVKAILAGYIGKLKTGNGVHIDCAMFDVQVAAMTNLASAWLNAGIEAVRVGTGHTNVAPYQVFSTSDGFIMIGIGNDVQFGRLAETMKRPEWAKMPEYASNGERVKNKAKLAGIMTEELMKKTSEEWGNEFKGKGFPFGKVNNMEEVFKHPSALHRKLVQEIDHPHIGSTKVVAPAEIFNGERMKIRLPPPGLGDDTIQILTDLGYDKAVIDSFLAAGDI